MRTSLCLYTGRNIHLNLKELLHIWNLEADQLETVFLNGELTKTQNFAEIRERAGSYF